MCTTEGWQCKFIGLPPRVQLDPSKLCKLLALRRICPLAFYNNSVELYYIDNPTSITSIKSYICHNVNTNLFIFLIFIPYSYILNILLHNMTDSTVKNQSTFGHFTLALPEIERFANNSGTAIVSYQERFGLHTLQRILCFLLLMKI